MGIPCRDSRSSESLSQSVDPQPSPNFYGKQRNCFKANTDAKQSPFLLPTKMLTTPHKSRLHSSFSPIGEGSCQHKDIPMPASFFSSKIFKEFLVHLQASLHQRIYTNVPRNRPFQRNPHRMPIWIEIHDDCIIV